jgi:hypothetical protein
VVLGKGDRKPVDRNPVTWKMKIIKMRERIVRDMWYEIRESTVTQSSIGTVIQMRLRFHLHRHLPSVSRHLTLQ